MAGAQGLSAQDPSQARCSHAPQLPAMATPEGSEAPRPWVMVVGWPVQQPM